MSGRWRRWAWIPAVAILAAPGVSGAQAPAGFEVETQARLGGDADDDGIGDGALTPSAARATRLRFVPRGCSGATVPRGLLGPYVGIEPDRERTIQPPQVELLSDLAARREIDAVLVSIGANDVHFGAIVQFCAAVKDCPERRFDPRETGKEAPEPGAPRLDAV